MEFIFNDMVYNKLNNEYKKSLSNTHASSLSKLNIIIQMIKTNNFQLPLKLHAQILNNLLKAKQVLSILHKQTFIKNTTNFTNNPFTLIFHLTDICSELNSNQFKSPNYILNSKASILIINSIKEISGYFVNKKLEIFRFL